MCAQWRLRSAWASTQSDQSLRCPHEESLCPYLPTERTVKTDQTGRMPRLIWIFAGHTCHFVGSVTRWLIHLCIQKMQLEWQILFSKNCLSASLGSLRYLGQNNYMCVSGFSSEKTRWAATWQNQQSECVPREDSDQPGHLSSLIRVFAVCLKKAWVLSYPLSAQQRLWSDLADAQADLNLRWAHTHFVGFVMSWLRYERSNNYFMLIFYISIGIFITFLPFFSTFDYNLHTFHDKCLGSRLKPR